MAKQFRLPDVGEGLTEAEIAAWHVNVGDTVGLNQMLLEVETAKAVVELPSPYAGTVLALHHQAGDVVPVGSPIVTIGDPTESTTPPDTTAPDAKTPTPTPTPTESQAAPDPAAPAPESVPTTGAAEQAAAPTAEPERQSVLVGYGVRKSAVTRRRRRAAPPPRTTPASMPHRPDPRPLATPPVRKLARDLSVDLATVTPTGPRGQITREDIRNATHTSPNGHSAPGKDTRTPIRGARKHIAEAMVQSAFTAPHVTEWLTVDITRTLKLIKDLRSAPSTRDLRITPLTLLARATILTLSRHRDINASWDQANSEIVQHHDINLGIAVASPRGLIVPNIPAAQTLDFTELAGALTDLVADARVNRTTVEAMRGGTFTITNVGVFGVDGATPILNPGEAAILALGQIREQPWNHKGRIRLRSTTTLSMSFDHRLVDGELGSKVLADIGELLEHPERAITK